MRQSWIHFVYSATSRWDPALGQFKPLELTVSSVTASPPQMQSANEFILLYRLTSLSISLLAAHATNRLEWKWPHSARNRMRKSCARGLHGTLHLAQEGHGRDRCRGSRTGAAAVLASAGSYFLPALRDTHRYCGSSLCVRIPTKCIP